jgi:hypothetical protein
MWIDSLITRIERAKPLDRVSRKLSLAFANVVRPGWAKDLLAGTWLGHPAHPMLTDLPIGAWTSAVILDLVGGKQARQAADERVGVGVLAAVPTAVTGLSDLADVVNPTSGVSGRHTRSATSPPSCSTAVPTSRDAGAAAKRGCGWPCWARPWWPGRGFSADT